MLTAARRTALRERPVAPLRHIPAAERPRDRKGRLLPLRVLPRFCARGHELTGRNVVWCGAGMAWRQCRICKQDRQNDRRREQRAAARAAAALKPPPVRWRLPLAITEGDLLCGYAAEGAP